jgi:hypothetical protein
MYGKLQDPENSGSVMHTALGGEFCGELLHAGLALPRPLHQHLRLGLLLLQLGLQRRDSTNIKKSCQER